MQSQQQRFLTKEKITLSTHMSNKVDGAKGGAVATEEEIVDNRSTSAWFVSFSATMMPFVAFCYSHQRGFTGKAVDRIVRSPVGVYGLLALPFLTLGMEKCIYDTVNSLQGINPRIRPKDRGGFPSGGAELPSFSLVPVKKYF